MRFKCPLPSEARRGGSKNAASPARPGAFPAFHAQEGSVMSRRQLAGNASGRFQRIKKSAVLFQPRATRRAHMPVQHRRGKRTVRCKPCWFGVVPLVHGSPVVRFRREAAPVMITSHGRGGRALSQAQSHRIAVSPEAPKSRDLSAVRFNAVV